MADRMIAQRELRNDVAAVLREAEAGTTLKVTVRGRHVADLGPPSAADSHLDRDSLLEILRVAPLDPGFPSDLEAVLGDTIETL